jgi:hypothetical protein
MQKLDQAMAKTLCELAARNDLENFMWHVYIALDSLADRLEIGSDYNECRAVADAVDTIVADIKNSAI